MKKFILILCLLSLFLTACIKSNVLELEISDSDESVPMVEIAENNIGFSPLFITEQQEHEENIIKLRVNKKQYEQSTKMFELVFYGDKIYINADIIEGLYAEPEWIDITEYCDAYGILYDDLPFMLANVEGYDYTTYHVTSMEERKNSHEEFYQLNDIEDLKLFADDIRQLYYDNKLNLESLFFPSMNSILTWESSTMTFGADNSGNESLHIMTMVCKKITIDVLRIPCFLYVKY